MVFATSELGGATSELGGVAGFLIGAFGIGFIWLICYLAGYREDVHVKWAGGVFYSTRKSHRICGKIGERVADGHWIGWIKSLWKTYDGHFFVLRIDELHPPTLTPVKPEAARQFIMNSTSEATASRLIREWLTGKSAE